MDKLLQFSYNVSYVLTQVMQMYYHYNAMRLVLEESMNSVTQKNHNLYQALHQPLKIITKQ